jgi:DTW domain-containing protein YfiP
MKLTKYCIVVGVSGVELPSATNLVLIKNTLEIKKNSHTQLLLLKICCIYIMWRRTKTRDLLQILQSVSSHDNPSTSHVKTHALSNLFRNMTS